MKEITPEQRHKAAMKAGATIRARKEAERERWRAETRDKENALTICREIRDNPEASAEARLEAIKLIAKITNR